MSAPTSNTQNPPIVASQTAAAAAANTSSPGPSANVAAGQPQPTARNSYAGATKKISSPPIASSGGPPVAVGGVPGAQHGKPASLSPVNGSNPIKPAVPAIGPTIVNSSANGDHSRKPSVTISAAGTSGHLPNGGPVASSRAPSNLTFGSLADSPAPAHAAPHQQGPNLNPQIHNPRVTSPAHSPSPIPTPVASGGRPSDLPTRPNLVFGGGSDSAEQSNRPINMPSQPHNHPQAQHLRRESSNSSHSDMNPNANRGFPPNNSGRGRGNFYPQMSYSPNQARAMPSHPRGNMAPAFQPQMHPNSPYRQPARSPALTPAMMAQQQAYYNGQYPPQQQMYGMPQPGMDPYQSYYGGNFAGNNYGLQSSMHAPPQYAVPNSPARGPAFPHAGPYPAQGGYPQPPQMARSASNMSERPPSVVTPSTPAMTNVNASHAHTPSATGGSPAPPAATTTRTKPKSKAIVIKNAEGVVIDFNNKKPTSPAPPAPPVQPKSPAIVQTPTPPPRPESAHSRNESVSTKTEAQKKADFVADFRKQLEAGDKQKKEAEEKSLKDKEEADAKAAKEKEEAEKAAAEKAEAEAAEKAKAEAAEKKRLDDEEFERMVAEMEAQEKEEEEREKRFQEQKAKDDAARKAREVAEEERKLKEAEAAADAAETARASQTDAERAESENLFASLKKNTQFGPGANAQSESGASTPVETPIAETPATETAQPKTAASSKPKPAHLKLETTKAVEPAQPTAGMQSLKSARFLQVKHEIAYPEGVRSPNPALNNARKSKGMVYDMNFLLQFQDVFKEKPSLEWDRMLKETVGDSTDSAAPRSARPQGMSMGNRQPSRGGGLGGAVSMGNFQGAFNEGRTLRPGTTSEERFRQSQRGPGTMTNPLASFVAPGRPGGFPMQLNRPPSFQNVSNAAPNSPRGGSSRGRGSRKPAVNKADEKAMPLTAGMEIKLPERSSTGWTPLSRTGGNAPLPSGHMAPDMVQRKVKAALNKMTPEKFDKISDQILEIAAQSKDEQDGRTLRQVIQLTFEKACDEQHWSSMYAKFCNRMLSTMSTEIKDENVTDKNGNPVVGGALFRKYLLNRCQEEFEKGWEINLPEKPEAGGEAALLSEEYYIAAAAKRRGLGLIQFIGELYKLSMLTLRIMHECVLKLLDFEGLPDESAVESLTKLLRTVGGTMAVSETGPKMLAVYFERIEKIAAMDGLPSRLRFMLMDLVDLRKANWQSKDAGKGPMTLTEIHAQAAAAQQAAEMERVRSQRGPRPGIGRGDARSFSGGGALPPQDFPTGRVGMDDLRKLSKGASGRNVNAPGGSLGPSMLGNRSGSGRRGLGPGVALMGRGDESGASSRTATPPVQKEKEPTSANSFSALMNLDNEGAGEVASPPSTASSPPPAKGLTATEAKDTKPSE